MRSVESDRARQLIDRATRRPPPTGQQETPEEVREATRAILARHTAPTPPDPLTGRVPPKRRRRSV